MSGWEIPDAVLARMAKHCRCCPCCQNPPCGGCMAGGMCDEQGCIWERDGDDDAGPAYNDNEE